MIYLALPPQRPWRRVIYVVGAALLLLSFLHFYTESVHKTFNAGRTKSNIQTPRLPHVFGDFDNLHFTEAQCAHNFPGLTVDIDAMVALGPFPLKQARDMGPLQLRLEKGQLSILHKESDDMLSRGYHEIRMAALHQIHRAVLSSPAPLPDTIISVNILDYPANETWSYSRPASAVGLPGTPAVTRAFLMPHFSLWGWPSLPFVGSFARAAAAIDHIEATVPFVKKDPRPVWRGTARYNSDWYPHMRTGLLRVAGGGAPWADVQEFKYEEEKEEMASNGPADPPSHTPGANKKAQVAANALAIEDFCRYKYVVHTEGITYSGRFQFHQMCASVILTPPLAWLQHTTHLVKPLYSQDVAEIQGQVSRQGGEEKKGTGVRKGAPEEVWPHYSPDEANIVFVAPDWSDLQATVEWLEHHPATAQGIAQRQRDLFVASGYFSPAAEACYWRAMIRAWSKVAQTEGHGWEGQTGIRWEEFAMGYDQWGSGVTNGHL